jgi:hypothetical protein
MTENQKKSEKSFGKKEKSEQTFMDEDQEQVFSKKDQEDSLTSWKRKRENSLRRRKPRRRRNPELHRERKSKVQKVATNYTN